MSFVITGNPGVGKHTIAKKISKILDIPILDINQIAKDAGLFEKSFDTNDVDVNKLSTILETKLVQPSLIVGHMAPYVIPTKKIEKVIVLRKNPYDLILVYEQRKYSKEKIKDNVGSEILGVILYDSLEQFGTKKIHQINVTFKTIEEVTKNVQDVIQGNEFSEEVDWLSEVSEKNDLEKFFAY